MRFLLVTLWVFMANTATANSDWINTSPNHTSNDYIYKGYGSATELSIAIDKARNNATEEAIRSLFGFSTKIDTKTYETSTSSNIVKRSADLSNAIRINGFQMIKLHKEYEGEQFVVTALFSYSKNEVEKEKQRLESLDEQLDVKLIAIQESDLKPAKVFNHKPEQDVKVKDIVDFYGRKIKNTKWTALREDNPFVIYLYGGYSSASTKADNDLSFLVGGLSLEKRLFNSLIGLKINCEYHNASEPSVNNGNLGINGTAYSLSIPIYFSGDTNNNYYIEPSYGRTNRTINLSKQQSLEEIIEQDFYDLSIGMQMLINYPASLDLKIGTRKYSDFEKYKGNTSFYGTIGLVAKF